MGDQLLQMMPDDLQAAFEGILRAELLAAVARGKESGIPGFTMILGLQQATVQAFLEVSRPLALRMLRAYLDAMEAPLGSTKHAHHIRRFSAAAEQMAQVMRAKSEAQGNG